MVEGSVHSCSSFLDRVKTTGDDPHFHTLDVHVVSDLAFEAARERSHFASVRGRQYVEEFHVVVFDGANIECSVETKKFILKLFLEAPGARTPGA